MSGKKKVSAVIVSAGNSSRMGGINKQFLEIGNMSVIARSISVFQNCSLINEIVVVTRENDIKAIKDIVEKHKFSKVTAVVKGGETRQLSVYNGVKATSLDSDYVAIHDGARPLVTEKVIKDTLSVAFDCGAATTGVKVKDTIKVVNENNEIIDTPDRSVMRAVQTPQIFAKDLYLNAVKSVPDSKNFTDDCMLIEAYGKTVEFVDGDYENIKITTPEDVALAESYLARREK